MKQYFFGLMVFLSFSVCAEPLKTPLDYLNAMHQAHKTENFEILYLFQRGEQVESLRYRHANAENKEYAQLLRLDQAREEIILRNNLISYFGTNFQPFSVVGTTILDSLPTAFYASFPELDTHYGFVDAGRGRIADRIARIIKVVPHDDFRYKYELWIDEESHLLLKSVLLDRDNNELEEFRVLQAYIDSELTYMIEPINSLVLPATLPLEERTEKLNWSPAWLPVGFKAINSGLQNLSGKIPKEKVESRLYSDGLFSFNIYLVENKGVSFNEQFWRQDKLSIYSQTMGNKDIVIIGEIPLSTAKYIAQQIHFGEQIE